MNDLARLFEPDEARDMLRKLAGLLIGLGLFMAFIRKSDPNLGETWGDWGLLIVLLLAFAFLYGVGMLGRLNTAGLRPWEAVYIVFGVLLAPFLLFQFVEAVNGTPGAALNVFWIFLVTGALAAAGSLVAGVGYGLLLAALALIVSWSALWDKILSGGISAHYGVYRGLLLVFAALLLGAALVAFRADRDRGPGRANELVTGAAVAAVLAGAISFTKLFSSPFFNPPTAESAFFWELVLLAVSLLAIAYGTRLGSRGATYVGGIGLLIFLIVAGADINDATPAGNIVGWPLVLVVGGLLAFAASLVPGLKASAEPGRRPEGPRPG